MAIKSCNAFLPSNNREKIHTATFYCSEVALWTFIIHVSSTLSQKIHPKFRKKYQWYIFTCRRSCNLTRNVWDHSKNLHLLLFLSHLGNFLLISCYEHKKACSNKVLEYYVQEKVQRCHTGMCGFFFFYVVHKDCWSIFDNTFYLKISCLIQCITCHFFFSENCFKVNPAPSFSSFFIAYVLQRTFRWTVLKITIFS